MRLTSIEAPRLSSTPRILNRAMRMAAFRTDLFGVEGPEMGRRETDGLSVSYRPVRDIGVFPIRSFGKAPHRTVTVSGAQRRRTLQAPGRRPFSPSDAGVRHRSSGRQHGRSEDLTTSRCHTNLLGRRCGMWSIRHRRLLRKCCLAGLTSAIA